MLLPYDCIIQVALTICPDGVDAGVTDDLIRWLLACSIPIASTAFVHRVAISLHMRKYKPVISSIPQHALKILVPELSFCLNQAMDDRCIPTTPANCAQVIRWCLEGHGYTALAREVSRLRARRTGTFFCHDHDRRSLPQYARGAIMGWPEANGIYVYSFSLTPSPRDSRHPARSDDVEVLNYFLRAGS